MRFFFGDSTPATFDGNFLEVLRDATVFAAQIAEADEAIVTVDARKAAFAAEAEADARRAEALLRAVLGTIAAADKGKVTSQAARLAAELAGFTTERHHIAGEAVRAKLSADRNATDEAVAAARKRYAAALEGYLRLGDPPGCERELTLVLGLDAETDEEHYEAGVLGRGPVGLAWALELAIPAGSAFASPLRVEALAPSLALSAPQRTGLIKKEVKRKRQKVHRWLVTRVVDTGARVRVSLRPERGDESGLALTIEPARNLVAAERVGAKGDPSAGPFPVDAEDVGPLVAFGVKVRDAARALPRRRMVSATLDGVAFDGVDVEAQPRLVQVVPRLMLALAPTVQEIAARSLARDELILRRTLPDGEREEIFLPKEMLREKVAPLDAAHRAMFAPLGLERSAPSLHASVPATPAAEPVASEPSAAEPSAPLEPTRTAPAADEAPPAPGADEPKRPSLEAQLAALPPMRPILRSQLPAASLPPPPPADVRRASRVPAPPSSKMRPPARTEPLMLTTRAKKRASIAPPRSPELTATLKEIRAMAKDGRASEAFRQLRMLYGTPAFAACVADDRRRALRLLVLSRPHPTAEDDRMGAHQAALPALQLLVVEHHAPSDYELLGMAYLALGEAEKATEIWKKALDLESARDPGSELCGSLKRRVSAE